MRRKGEAESLGGEVIPALVSGAIAIAIMVYLIILIFRITNDVNINQNTRNEINLASMLMTNEDLIYVENGRLYRGLFVESKLIDAKNEGCASIETRYTSTGIRFKKFDDTTETIYSICSPVDTSEVPFPVSIKNGDNIYRGIMYVSVKV